MAVVFTELHDRKSQRLPGHDYSRGVYHITVCVKDKHALLGKIAEDNALLSSLGQITESAIRAIPGAYSSVIVKNFVVMPNHVHLLLVLRPELAEQAPTVSHVIQQWKGIITKQAGFSFWQKSFDDRIIRNQEQYQIAMNYIDMNPLKWKNDDYYIPDEHQS